jgi:DNA-directed RNA polymerase specialized sigma24 family protein
VGEPDEKLEALVQRYGALIRGAVAKALGRRDDAVGDDVAQQVSEALWKQLRREQIIEHPSSYLYRCAVRETVRIIQREIDRGEVALDAAVDVAAAARPDALLEARELEQATDAIIDQLAPDRAAAVRAHIAGFSVDEIMAMHGWGYQKARNLIARGVADLRSQLRERGVA